MKKERKRKKPRIQKFQKWEKKSWKMPKIFLIKNRLHQQQLKLLESQNLKDDADRLVSPQTDLDEPLALVKREQREPTGWWHFFFFVSCYSNITTTVYSGRVQPRRRTWLQSACINYVRKITYEKLEWNVRQRTFQKKFIEFLDFRVTVLFYFCKFIELEHEVLYESSLNLLLNK